MGKVNLGRNTGEVKAKIPPYQKEFYSRIYESPRLNKWFDNGFLLNILTLGAGTQLAKTCAAEIDVRSKVLQLGVSAGCQIDEVAAKIGVYGQMDLLDVSLTRLRYAGEKYRYKYPFIKYINRDAADSINKKYDVVICYLLFHELPPHTYSTVLNNALDALAPGGKAIFIDYGNPTWWNPARYLAKYFNRLYQPFAERIWDKEIRLTAKRPTDYYWRKTTYLGGMYQKVVVTKKEIY